MHESIKTAYNDEVTSSLDNIQIRDEKIGDSLDLNVSTTAANTGRFIYSLLYDM